MGLSIKVKAVKPLENMVLLVEFENGVKKEYDVSSLIPQFPIYRQLENNSLFSNVEVVGKGYAIAWNDEIDISEVELWEGGNIVHSLIG
ncbi:MAG: DUF2442 domain-containing protein [Defluviitaleaceae bacterium]|nr:DUF2442 domain-containing protein [Defluviitaleaceae bacterium]